MEELTFKKSVSGIVDLWEASKPSAEYLSGRHHSQYHLWDIFMFQVWFTEQAVAE